MVNGYHDHESGRCQPPLDADGRPNALWWTCECGRRWTNWHCTWIAASQVGISEHRYLGARGADIGYVGSCACGWRTAEKPTRRSAQGAVAAHIGRAP